MSRVNMHCERTKRLLSLTVIKYTKIDHFLAPAVTVGETEGAMDSTSVFFFASSFAYNFVRK